MAGQKQDDQLEYAFGRYVRIRDVAQKTCLRRMNDREKWRERGSGISVLAARHEDDDDDYKKAMKYKNDGDANCNERARYSHQWIGSGTGGFGKKRG